MINYSLYDSPEDIQSKFVIERNEKEIKEFDIKNSRLARISIPMKSAIIDLLETIKTSHPDIYNHPKAAKLFRLCNTWTDIISHKEGE